MKLFAWCVPLLAVSLAPVCADLVLLDEYWSPEIVVNDVVVTEVDTQDTGDTAEARFGECSAKLENEWGAPSVRFRGAARMKLSETPPGDSDLVLWYRTNGWSGTWRAEVWVWYEALQNAPAPAPVKVLQASLDGGGDDGHLIADDQWHEARGTIEAADAFEGAPKDESMSAAYLWLVPIGGWDIAHRTYVDRVSIEVVAGDQKGNPAPAPARRIRPQPGAQIDGPGWVWFEGEDAADHNVPIGGALMPVSQDEQALLSNDMWLCSAELDDLRAEWEITVPEAGRYALWCRAPGTSFRWRWDEGPWQDCGPGSAWVDFVRYQDHGHGWIEIGWACLGRAELAAGRHVLSVAGVPDDKMVGFDCWLVTREEFTPDGAHRPTAD